MGETVILHEKKSDMVVKKELKSSPITFSRKYFLMKTNFCIAVSKWRNISKTNRDFDLDQTMPDVFHLWSIYISTFTL